MKTTAQRALVGRDGLQAVTEWERLEGELTEQEMAEARQRVADELRRAPHRSA